MAARLPAAGAAIIGRMIYVIGREYGYWLLLRYGGYLWITQSRIKLGQYLFLRHGGKIILIAQFLPVLRSIAGIFAGASRMPWLRSFINGCSGALETTYVNPAPNFFRFNIDGAQMHKGLGQYIYNVKHYKKIATLAEDYAFTYTQVFGLALDFCPLGGQIMTRLWVPLGTKDFSSVIAKLPDDVDAIYLGLGGADAINFLNQYQQAGGNAKLIGGSIMVDQTILSSKGKAKEALVGVVSAGPQADTWVIPDGRLS